MIFKSREYRDKVLLYKRCFGTKDGREVLFDLMNVGHVLNTHKGDVFKEGQRAIVLDILQKCNISVAELDKLIKGEQQ